MSQPDLTHSKVAVALLSVISNATLVVFKLIVGLGIGSVSVMSEAIHSGVDLIAAAIALFAVRTSSKPADREHPFGHGKVENISGAVEALLIFVAAGWITYEAVHKLRHPQPLEAAGWGVAVMLVSAVVNTIVSTMLFRVGKATDSVALEADAWHLRTDVYTSAGVMVGLAAIWLGQAVLPGVELGWLDPLCAVVVAALIVKAAWKLTVQAGRDLLDASLPEDEQQLIREIIAENVTECLGYHDLRTRKAGSQRFVEFHLDCPAEVSIGDAHTVSDSIESAIRARLPGTRVTIHAEPPQGT